MMLLDNETAFDQAQTRGFAAIDGFEGDPADLETFARSSGRDLVFTPGEQPLPGTSHVFEVTNRGRPSPPVSVWHTDTSYVAEPPAFTILLAVEAPERGGETLVLDQRRALDELDRDLRAEVDRIELLHTASRVSHPDDVGPGSWHPLVRHHTPTGAPTLYLSTPERHPAWRRRGQPATWDRPDFIDAIYRRCTQRTAHRHRWRPGRLLIIDNRITIHRADHSAVTGHRTLWRVMTAGEIPIAEDRR